LTSFCEDVPDIFIYIYLFEGDLHIKVLSDSFQM